MSGPLEALLRLPEPPTAVIAANDWMAAGFYEAMEQRKLRVPEDLSVIGVDGHELGEVIGLTSIAQPAESQGSDAARFLLGMVNGEDGPPAETTLYPTELIVRTSTAPPPD